MECTFIPSRFEFSRIYITAHHREEPLRTGAHVAVLRTLSGRV